MQLLTVLVALFCLPGISFGEKIVVYSAVYPPYQIDHNGKLTGINTEIVRAIFQHSGVPFEIKYVPWSRAQKYVGDDSQKNSAIYCLGRNEQREDKYKWVGVYFYQKVSFLTLKPTFRTLSRVLFGVFWPQKAKYDSKLCCWALHASLPFAPCGLAFLLNPWRVVPVRVCLSAAH